MPTTPRHDWRQHLEVETPEHVVIDYELAGLGSRTLAAFFDTLILGLLLLAVELSFGVLARVAATLGVTILIVLQFLLLTGYYTFFEAFWRGQTPGKRWMGIRVVHDTGHGVSFGGAVLRNLLRVADSLPPPYLLGGLLVALHPRAKRLGDIVAGTVVVRDRPHHVLAPTVPELSAEPSAAPELDDGEFALLRSFRERVAALPGETRRRLASRLAGRFRNRYAAAGGDAEAFLETLYLEESARRRGRLGARGPSAVERFVARKEGRWAAFAALAERAGGQGLDGFGAEELPEFAARYRETAADLARARTYRADPRLVSRLERLVSAGHNALYRRERSTGRRVLGFFGRECPAAVVEARRYVFLAFLTFSLPAIAGYAVLRERPALGPDVLPDGMLERARAGAARAQEGLGYYEAPPGERPIMASGIIANNVRVATLCFAGGVFGGVGSLVLLGFNGLSIGAASGHFANAGLLGYLWAFIAGHGVLELFAIWVAGAAGFLIGRAVIAPGRLSRGDALILSGRLGVRLLGAAVVLLGVAGIIEGFVSASTLPLPIRMGTSFASVLLLFAYLLLGQRLSGRSAG